MRNTFTLILAFFLSCTPATCSSAIAAQNGTHQSRAAETCADPTLATVYINAFSPTRTAHLLRSQLDMVMYDTSIGINDNFQFQSPTFLAWRSPQEFTVPFHQLVSPSGNDIIYLSELDGNPPTASGFVDQGIAGYAYTTQICGSVPLFSAFNDAASDHWWTTSQSDHSVLLANGWLDGGIVFYVLPLGCSCLA